MLPAQSRPARPFRRRAQGRSLVLAAALLGSLLGVVSPAAADPSVTPPAGTVFVGDTNHRSVVRFDGGGPIALGSGWVTPEGVAVDADGNLYVADVGLRQVERIAPDGSQTTVLDHAVLPQGVAVDGEGNVVVADWSRVVVIPGGTGTPVVRATGFTGTVGVAVDTAGRLFVSDFAAGDVVRIDPDDSQTLVASGLASPIGVAVDTAGNLYVAEHGVGRDAVVVIPADGGPRTSLGSGLSSADQVALDAAGNVYVADQANSRIVKIPVGGGPQETVGAGFLYPNGVAVMAPPPTLTAGTPPASAQVGVVYSYTYAADVAPGEAAARFRVVDGALPPGLSLDPVTGVLSGTPTAPGSATFVVQAENAVTADRAPAVTVTVAPAPPPPPPPPTPKVTLTAPATVVYGEPASIAVEVADPGSGVMLNGTVTVALDGTNVATVQLDQGRASTALTSPAHPLAPGTHRIDVSTSTAGGYAAGSATTSVLVTAAATTTALAPRRDALEARVRSQSPSTLTPTGTVTFRAGETVLGEVELVDGVASLPYSGPAESLSAAFAGGNAWLPSSDSVVRRPPTITAEAVSPRQRTRAGWYSAPVTVHFTCTAAGAPLVGGCPAPVVLRGEGADQSVTRTVLAEDGAGATAFVAGISIDRTRPQARVTGVRDGATYRTRRHAVCHASDAVSGIASCTVAMRQVRRTAAFVRFAYRVTAIDLAGNRDVLRGHYRVRRG